MGRKLFAFLCLLLASAVLTAEAVDAKICDILAHPSAFDNKMVRITGTVIAGFDEFVVKDASCKLPVNSVWLAYPEGVKAKSGPAAAVYLQLAKNSPGQPSAEARIPSKLDTDKEFKEFDSLLSARPKTRGTCLGCFRSAVTATLIGRLDGVDKTSLERTGEMFTAIHGYGNLARYPARLVVQSVSGVAGSEIDYEHPGALGDGDVQLRLSPEQAKRAADAYGGPGELNGVEVNFSPVGTLAKEDGAKGTASSPDGLLFNVVFAPDRFEGATMYEAMAHTGTHIADLRERPNDRNLYQLESRACSVTLIAAVGKKEKTLTAPGNYQLWSDTWSDADRQKFVPGAISGLLSNWSALGK